MVNLSIVQASIQSAPSRLSPPFVAVLVGGTSGIGEATVKTLARHVASPGARFYIVGRNESAAGAIIAECERLSPRSEDVEFVFIRQDVSLLKNVDMVCAQIAAREDHVDLLFMTQGYLNLGGRNETSEGIDALLSLRFYSRMRFTHNLLPLLSAAPSARVISVFAPGFAGELAGLDLSDLGLAKTANQGIARGLSHASLMTTLQFEELAARNETLAFVHLYPGEVITPEFERADFPAWLKWLWLWVFGPVVGRLFALSYEEVGARMMFAGLSARYPPAASPLAARSQGSGAGQSGRPMLPLPEGIQTARGSAGQVGSGAYCLDRHGEPVNNGKKLERLRKLDAGRIIWEHTMEVFESIKSV